MRGRPFQCAVQAGSHFGSVEPKLVVGDHLGCFDSPNAFCNLFDRHGPTCKLLAERNLSAGTNRLYFNLHDCMIA